MWRKGGLWAAAWALAATWAAWAQEPPKPGPDGKPRPGVPGDEDDLTPEKAMALLAEARDLMGRAEELLHGSSHGKALETEEEVLKRLKDLLAEEAKSDPTVFQKEALERIHELLRKTERTQKDAVERMAEILRKAKS